MDLIDLSDEELLRRLLAGNEDAFVALYRRRQPAIYRFAFHMSGSRSIAEEVVQEVFLSLIHRHSKYDHKRGTVVAYLFGVARNHVLRCLERDRSFVAIDGRANEAVPTAREDAVESLARTDTIESVRRAVLALPATYREAVVLCDLQEMSYADAAQALGCAVGTVRSRIHRGRDMLAERLRVCPRGKQTRCVV